MHKTLIVLLSAGIALTACEAVKDIYRGPSMLPETETSSHLPVLGIDQNAGMDAAKIWGADKKTRGAATA